MNNFIVKDMILAVLSFSSLINLSEHALHIFVIKVHAFSIPVPIIFALVLWMVPLSVRISDKSSPFRLNIHIFWNLNSIFFWKETISSRFDVLMPNLGTGFSFHPIAIFFLLKPLSEERNKKAVEKGSLQLYEIYFLQYANLLFNCEIQKLKLINLGLYQIIEKF